MMNTDHRNGCEISLGADRTVVQCKSGLCCITGSARPLVLLELLGGGGRPGLLVPGDSGHEDPVLVVGGPGVATHQLAVAAGSDDAGLGAEAKLGAEGDGTGFIIERPQGFPSGHGLFLSS